MQDLIICLKPNQIRMKNKKVTDVFIEKIESCEGQPFLLNMHKRDPGRVFRDTGILAKNLIGMRDFL